MKNLRICPNCGLSVFGPKCKRCNYVFPVEKPVARGKTEHRTLQAVESTEPTTLEPAVKPRSERPQSSTMIVFDAQQKSRRIIHAAEQAARDISNKAVCT